jgi:hypothetical protein
LQSYYTSRLQLIKQINHPTFVDKVSEIPYL